MVGLRESNRVQCVRWVCFSVELSRSEILVDFVGSSL